MVSTSGSRLLPQPAVKELREHLLRLTTVLTPNVPEAMLLLENALGTSQADPQNLDDLQKLVKGVQRLGPKWVLLKGGHLPLTKDYVVSSKESADSSVVVNILYNGSQLTLIETPFLPSKSTHGTGCSLACRLSVAFHLWFLC